MRTTIFAATLVIFCGAGAAHAQAPVADFFSSTSLKSGELLPVGTIIEAYDSDGIRCGQATSNASGFLIHVYGNDPMTPSIDEGAREGEFLNWKIDGIDVLSENALWIQNLIGTFSDIRWENGAAKEIRLEASPSATEGASWSELKARYRP